MAQNKNAALFEESSQGSVSAVTFIGFVLSIVLVIGGFIAMGYGVNIELGHLEIWTFAGGLAATVLGFMIPFAILPAIGK